MNKTSLSLPIFSTTHQRQIMNPLPSYHGSQFLNSYPSPPRPIQSPPPYPILNLLALPHPHLILTLSLILSVPCLSTLHLPHCQPPLIFQPLPLDPPQPNTHSMITRGKARISKPKRFFGCLSHTTLKIDWTQTRAPTFQ